MLASLVVLVTQYSSRTSIEAVSDLCKMTQFVRDIPRMRSQKQDRHSGLLLYSGICRSWSRRISSSRPQWATYQKLISKNQKKTKQNKNQMWPIILYNNISDNIRNENYIYLQLFTFPKKKHARRRGSFLWGLSSQRVGNISRGKGGSERDSTGNMCPMAPLVTVYLPLFPEFSPENISFNRSTCTLSLTCNRYVLRELFVFIFCQKSLCGLWFGHWINLSLQ